jgi:hypothetical protein
MRLRKNLYCKGRGCLVASELIREALVARRNNAIRQEADLLRSSKPSRLGEKVILAAKLQVVQPSHALSIFMRDGQDSQQFRAAWLPQALKGYAELGFENGQIKELGDTLRLLPPLSSVPEMLYEAMHTEERTVAGKFTIDDRSNRYPLEVAAGHVTMPGMTLVIERALATLETIPSA